VTFGQLRCLFAAISAARARALLYMHGSTQRRPSPSQTRRQSGPPRSRHWAPRRVQHGKLGNGGQMAGGHGVAVRRARMHRCRQQVREQRGRRPYRGARLAARLRRARGRSRRAGRRRRVGGAAALPANTQTAVKHRAAAHSGLNKPDDAARCLTVTHPPFDACPCVAAMPKVLRAAARQVLAGLGAWGPARALHSRNRSLAPRAWPAVRVGPASWLLIRQ